MKFKLIIDKNLFDGEDIIWETLNNPFTEWWLLKYLSNGVSRSHITGHNTHTGKMFDADDFPDPEEMLSKASLSIQNIIIRINEFIGDEKGKFPVDPQEVNLKLDEYSRQLLNTIHRYFTTLSFPKTTEVVGNYRSSLLTAEDANIFNWYKDPTIPRTLDYCEGDFKVCHQRSRDLINMCELLNWAVHDIEPLYYYHFNDTRNMLDCSGVKIIHQDTKIYHDIPLELYKYQSSDSGIDVWCPQDCILEKSPPMAYIDNDVDDAFDIHNGHQVQFDYEFTNRSDREFLKNAGFGMHIEKGWPLGKIIQGADTIEKIKSTGSVGSDIFSRTEIIHA